MSSSRAGVLDPSKVAIVLVDYNGIEDTLQCLDSLKLIQSSGSLTIVVDNGSEVDRTSEIRAAYPWVDVIRREVNGGWAGGNNAGIRHALERGAEWVILLNNDTIVDPGLVDHLIAAAASRPRFGVIGPVICFMDERDVVMEDGTRFNRPGHPGFFERIEVPITPVGSPEVTEVDIVNGCCMMISAEVFRRIGLIDERYFLIHEETDFCLRALRAGFACGVMSEVLVWHKGASTFNRSGGGLRRYFDARNLFLLLREHRRTHRGGRGAIEAWRTYIRYLFHRYCDERDKRRDEVAEAVVEGLCHALRGQFGPRPSRPGGSVRLALILFETGRRVMALRSGATAFARRIDAIAIGPNPRDLGPQ